MEVHRVEGIKYNFDRMSDEEIEGLRGHLLNHHEQLTAEIGLVDEVLFRRAHTELELGGAALGAALEQPELPQ